MFDQVRDEDEVARVWVPPGWPGMVRPPKSPGWVESAAAFLFDCCPPDLRGHQVLRRHPVVLARFAHHTVAAQLAAMRTGLASLRLDLSGEVGTNTIEEAVAALQAEQARLVRRARAVDLVERALRDERFVPKL